MTPRHMRRKHTLQVQRRLCFGQGSYVPPCSSFHSQTHAVFNIAALNAFSIIHCTAAETAILLHDVFLLQFRFYTNSQNERFQSRKGYNFYLTEHNSTKASKPLVCLTFLVPKSTDAFSFSIRKTWNCFLRRVNTVLGLARSDTDPSPRVGALTRTFHSSP